MHARFVLAAFLMVPSTGCKSVDCGNGTTERNGACVPSSETVAAAKCGPFTELHGDMCVPMFPPTVCDPGTTAGDPDVGTGVTTCIGTSTGCSTKLPCPAPTDGTQTICGQIYSFETGDAFAAPDPSGARCSCPATAGPCALGIKAYDAIAFAMSGGTSGALTTGEVYIDDCGRYRVSNIASPTGPLIALGFDDADPTKAGPMGVTNAVGIATPKGVPATKDLDAFVVAPATAIGWAGAGVPFDASNGIFASIFRGHRTGTDLASGVAVTRNGSTDALHDYYFAPGARRSMPPPPRRAPTARPCSTSRVRSSPTCTPGPAGSRPGAPGSPIPVRRSGSSCSSRPIDPPTPPAERARSEASVRTGRARQTGRRGRRARRERGLGGSDQRGRRRAVPQLVRHRRRVQPRGRAAHAQA
jgi:hypothetical protein